MRVLVVLCLAVAGLVLAPAARAAGQDQDACAGIDPDWFVARANEAPFARQNHIEMIRLFGLHTVHASTGGNETVAICEGYATMRQSGGVFTQQVALRPGANGSVSMTPVVPAY